MWPARIVQAALVAAGLAASGLAGAQEIQLTGPLCGAPAGLGREPLRSGLELTATTGAVGELGAGATPAAGGHDAMPALGFETRLDVDSVSRIRMGPALGVTESFGPGLAKNQLTGDAGWMLTLPMLRVLELSTTAGATGLTPLGRAGASSLGFHAGAAIELEAPWQALAPHATVGVGFDVRAFQHAPTMIGLNVRFGAEIARPVTCEPNYWE